MNIIILIVAITLVFYSILLLRKSEQRPKYKWLCVVLLLGSIPFFIMLYGVLGGLFVAIATTLLCGIFVALFFGKFIVLK